jgi:CelD/BcsL family acetyltransferase involved in cellulose biosynthesis
MLACEREYPNYGSPQTFHSVDLDSISADIWDGVALDRRTPMQQHIWVKAAAQALSPDRPVRVVLVGSPESPAALAPLREATQGPSRLSLLGAEELGEPVEVIYRTPDALDTLASGLAATGMPIGFGHYLTETVFIDALKRAYRRRGIVAVRPLPMRAAPYITLSENWIEPEQNFSSRRRSDLRRMQRAAEKLGTVTTQIVSPDPADVPALLEEAMAVESQSWKGRSGTAIVHNQLQETFYRAYAEAAARAGILRICFLRIAGHAAAMQIGVETEGAFWLLKIGYDEAYKKCSPGNLLLRETIRDAAQKGLKSYEFLGKEAPWTQVWAEQAHPIAALRVYPVNFSGMVSALSDAGQLARKRLSKTASDE